MKLVEQSNIKKTSIQISGQTRLKLIKLGTLASTYDSVINDLIEHCTKCDGWWENK